METDALYWRYVEKNQKEVSQGGFASIFQIVTHKTQTPRRILARVSKPNPSLTVSITEDLLSLLTPPAPELNLRGFIDLSDCTLESWYTSS